MKAAVLHGKEDFKVEDVDDPRLSPDGVIIRVKAVGVCGTVFWVDPVEEMVGVMLTQIAPFFHLNVRPMLAVCATQAIIDSNSNRPFSAMGYEKLP